MLITSHGVSDAVFIVAEQTHLQITVGRYAQSVAAAAEMAARRQRPVRMQQYDRAKNIPQNSYAAREHSQTTAQHSTAQHSQTTAQHSTAQHSVVTWTLM